MVEHNVKVVVLVEYNQEKPGKCRHHSLNFCHLVYQQNILKMIW